MLCAGTLTSCNALMISRTSSGEEQQAELGWKQSLVAADVHLVFIAVVDNNVVCGNSHILQCANDLAHKLGRRAASRARVEAEFGSCRCPSRIHSGRRQQCCVRELSHPAMR